MSILRRGRSLFVDLLVVGLASVAAIALRENFTLTAVRFTAFLPYLLVTLAVAVFVLVLLELDRAVWRFSGPADDVRAAFAAPLIVLGAVAIGFLVDRLEGVARALPMLQLVVVAAALVGVRKLVRATSERRLRAIASSPLALPKAEDTVLLVGWGSLVGLYVRSAAELGGGRIHIAGILSPQARHVGRTVQTIRVLGTPEEAGKIRAELDVHGIHVGRIVVMTTLDRLSDEARRVLRDMESATGVRVELLAERLGLSDERDVLKEPGVPTSARAGEASVGLDEEMAFAQALRRPYWRFKRLFDAALALALLIVLSPLILLVSLIVALDAGLPVLFVQQRPGHRGRRFNLYKFRTMGPAHDAAGARVPDEARLSWSGAWLRRTRIDELPQLCNILLGHMSFVGPRPLVACEQSQDTVARLLVRPGLTGWAQIQGGRTLSVADKTALDLWYVRHASFGLDLRLIFATLPLMLFGERGDGDAIDGAWRDLRG